MKKIFLLAGFALTMLLANAQRFFYIESSRVSESSIRSELLKATQYVTQSPLSSDYIIKADVGYTEGSNILSMKIILEDSITLKAIYQTTEEQVINRMNPGSRIALGVAVRYFINRNLPQMILCARDDHYDSRMKCLKPRKDKT
jgi:hypothetical protein